MIILLQVEVFMFCVLRLFAAEPAGEAGLGLGGLGLDLAVELVHLLERAGLDVLCVGLGVGLGLGDLGLALLELCWRSC